jgi:hypothetical protein
VFRPPTKYSEYLVDVRKSIDYILKRVNASYVSKIIAGDNITISPSTGQGEVTISASNTDKNFVFTQGSPSSTWNVSHGLDKFPSVSVVDSANNEVEGDVHFIDVNNLTITFSSSFAGKAYLN